MQQTYAGRCLGRACRGWGPGSRRACTPRSSCPGCCAGTRRRRLPSCSPLPQRRLRQSGTASRDHYSYILEGSIKSWVIYLFKNAHPENIAETCDYQWLGYIIFQASFFQNIIDDSSKRWQKGPNSISPFFQSHAPNSSNSSNQGTTRADCTWYEIKAYQHSPHLSQSPQTRLIMPSVSTDLDEIDHGTCSDIYSPMLFHCGLFSWGNWCEWLGGFVKKKS